jgi:hypothetical protein
MRKLSGILSVIGSILFIYTVAARFIGDDSIMGFTRLPFIEDGFTAVGTFSGTACILLFAVLAKLKSME